MKSGHTFLKLVSPHPSENNMEEFVSKLRVVQLSCPYDSWNDLQTRKLYNEIITLKLAGYQAEYPYGVLPIDTTDLIASHHLVCEELPDGNFKPLMGYRSISYARCKIHNVTFPPLALMEATKNHEHAESIKTILKTCEQKNDDIAYDSSWTVLPEIRRDESKINILREIMNSMHALYHTEGGPKRVIAGGVIRFKMEKMYYFWGYKDLVYNGKNLPPIDVPFVCGEKTLFFSLEKFSDKALEVSKMCRELWSARLIIEEQQRGQKKAA